jgi:aminoglycoside 6'-N-acetyltransferase
MVLRGERVILQPVVEEDLPALLAMIREPAVARWWGEYDLPGLRRDLLEETETFAVTLGEEVIGLVMVSEENDPQYRHAALDISLATAYHGRGFGRESLNVVIDHLVEERGHHRFTIDPAVNNEVAVRCYSAVGFRPVGVMRRYERTPDGTWRDGLLMDLLAEERATSPPAPSRPAPRERGGRSR